MVNKYRRIRIESQESSCSKTAVHFEARLSPGFVIRYGMTDEPQAIGLRKHAATIQPGQTEYLVHHNLGTREVIVQTRIAGRIREGGISIRDENTIQIVFGGRLNEPMEVVVVG